MTLCHLGANDAPAFRENYNAGDEVSWRGPWVSSLGSPVPIPDEYSESEEAL